MQHARAELGVLFLRLRGRERRAVRAVDVGRQRDLLAIVVTERAIVRIDRGLEIAASRRLLPHRSAAEIIARRSSDSPVAGTAWSKQRRSSWQCMLAPQLSYSFDFCSARAGSEAFARESHPNAAVIAIKRSVMRVMGEHHTATEPSTDTRSTAAGAIRDVVGARARCRHDTRHRRESCGRSSGDHDGHRELVSSPTSPTDPKSDSRIVRAPNSVFRIELRFRAPTVRNPIPSPLPLPSPLRRARVSRDKRSQSRSSPTSRRRAARFARATVQYSL